MIDWPKLSESLENRVGCIRGGPIYVDLIDGISAWRQGYLVNFGSGFVSKYKGSIMGSRDQNNINIEAIHLQGFCLVQVDLYKSWDDGNSEECIERRNDLNSYHN